MSNKCSLISDITKFSNFLMFPNVFLGVGMLHGCMGAFSGKEDGMQLLARLTPSSQTVRSLLRTPVQQSQ
jgi:hypothetical protein